MTQLEVFYKALNQLKKKNSYSVSKDATNSRLQLRNVVQHSNHQATNSRSFWKG